MIDSDTSPPSIEEQLSRRVRHRFSAVPLNPWRVNHPSSLDAGQPVRPEALDQSYLIVSLHTLEDILTQRLDEVVQAGYPLDDDRKDIVSDFLKTSLRNAHMRRIHHSGDALQRAGITVQDLNGDPLVAEAAARGMATPRELFQLIVDNPPLGSIEIAKFTHPFDFAASREMDEEVIESAFEAGFMPLGSGLESAHYKIKQINRDNGFATVLQKIPVASYVEGDQHRILMRRQSLFVRGDEEVLPDEWSIVVPRRMRRIHTEGDHHDDEAWFELCGYIRQALDDPEHAIHSPWVQPITTSYYVRSVTKETE